MIEDENKIFVRNLSVSPIGGIRIACFVKNGAGVLERQRVLPHFTLVYVLRGGGHYEDETGAFFDVETGDAILVMPGQRHWYGPRKGERWDELYLVFEGPVFDLWRTTGCFEDMDPVIPLRPSDYWVDRIKAASGENNGGNPSKTMAEVVRMQALLADIRAAAKSDAKADIVWLAAAKAALKKMGSPHDASKNMGLAYEVFRKRFRKLAGIPPGKYRTAHLMEEACDYLTNSTFTLKEIAFQLGYCDEYHFSKQFSKTIGWSPREYRARTSASSDKPSQADKNSV